MNVIFYLLEKKYVKLAYDKLLVFAKEQGVCVSKLRPDMLRSDAATDDKTPTVLICKLTDDIVAADELGDSAAKERLRLLREWLAARPVGLQTCSYRLTLTLRHFFLLQHVTVLDSEDAQRRVTHRSTLYETLERLADANADVLAQPKCSVWTVRNRVALFLGQSAHSPPR